jgi:hypothetical protein
MKFSYVCGDFPPKTNLFKFLGTMELQWGFSQAKHLSIRGLMKSVEVLSCDAKGAQIVKCVLQDDRTFTAEVDTEAFKALLSATQPVVPLTPAQKRRNLLWIAGSVLFLGFVGSLFSGEDPGATQSTAAATAEQLQQAQRDQREQAEQQNEVYAVSAFIESQGIVKKCLKCPSTASFPNMLGEDVDVRQSEEVVIVSAYVDAENSFGAKIRTAYFCRFKKLPGEDGPVKLERFVFDSKTVFDAYGDD